MFLSSLLSYFYPSSASQATAPSVALPPLQVRDLERIHDPASRRTRQFLKLIHMSDALVPKKHYSEHQDRISFLSHLVISVYLLGANADQITQLCDGFQGVREQWEQAPSEVTKHDWRDFLGNPASVKYRGGHHWAMNVHNTDMTSLLLKISTWLCGFLRR